MFFYCLIFGQNVDHAYYTSKIYGPGDIASRELWVNADEMGEEWKVRGFLSSAHRQAEVQVYSSKESFPVLLRLSAAIEKTSFTI